MQIQREQLQVAPLIQLTPAGAPRSWGDRQLLQGIDLVAIRVSIENTHLHLQRRQLLVSSNQEEIGRHIGVLFKLDPWT
jgi:hypothetical protein